MGSGVREVTGQGRSRGLVGAGEGLRLWMKLSGGWFQLEGQEPGGSCGDPGGLGQPAVGGEAEPGCALESHGLGMSGETTGGQQPWCY